MVAFCINHRAEGYPELEGDEARRAIWLYDVPLTATHHLRNALNNGKADFVEILEKYEIPIVASVLKLYLLELPGQQPSFPHGLCCISSLLSLHVRGRVSFLTFEARLARFLSGLRNRQDDLLDNRARDNGRRADQSVAEHTRPTPPQQYCHA